MDMESLAIELLPARLREKAFTAGEGEIEEIRLRQGQRPSLLLRRGERGFHEEVVDEELLQRVMEKATGASMQAAAPALAEGYLSYRGIRIGVCGSAVLREGRLSGFRHISSLAIRIPRQCRGVCDSAVMQFLRSGFQNTLILGRPGEGKTTALREMIRGLSDGGLRIGVADERNELAAVDGSGPQFDLGRCSDVLTGVPKGQGVMMLLRGMNPQVLAMDEVTREEDLEAVLQAVGCGAGVLATAHADGVKSLRERKLYRMLLDQGVFQWAFQVRNTAAGRIYSLEKLSV